MFGKRPAGGTYDTPFGALQDVSLKSGFGVKKLMGPGALTPIAVAASERTVTGSAKWAKIRARSLQMLMNGTVATATGKTTYTANAADDLPTFDLQCKSPADGSATQLNLYNCYASDVNIPLTMNDFSIPDFSFECMGRASDGVLFEIILPGDQTIS
jgi:hypothetical protein